MSNKFSKTAMVSLIILIIVLFVGCSKNKSQYPIDDNGNIMNTEKKKEATINIAFDENVAWKSIADANGGLSTKKGSIYNQLCVDVNISIINDNTHSSDSLINGELDAVCCTINNAALLYEKFENADIELTVPYIVSSSNGSTYIVLFNSEFAESHEKIVSKFIKGSLLAANMYDTETDIVKDVMPTLSGASDEYIKKCCSSVELATYEDNIYQFNYAIKTSRTKADGVWKLIDDSLVYALFNRAYLDRLSGEFK